MSNENEKWRKFLQPLVEVMLGLGIAMTAYFQHSGSSEFESRLAVVEVQVGEQSRRSDRFDVDIDNFKALLSDIRSDVSFIRGKMERR